MSAEDVRSYFQVMYVTIVTLSLRLDDKTQNGF